MNISDYPQITKIANKYNYNKIIAEDDYISFSNEDYDIFFIIENEIYIIDIINHWYGGTIKKIETDDYIKLQNELSTVLKMLDKEN